MPEEECYVTQDELNQIELKEKHVNNVSIDEVIHSLDLTKSYCYRYPLPQEAVDNTINLATVNLLIEFSDKDHIRLMLRGAGIRKRNSILGTLKEIVLGWKIEMLQRSIGYHNKINESIDDESINKRIAHYEQLIDILESLGACNSSFEKKEESIAEIEDMLTTTSSTIITITANFTDNQFISRIYRERHPFKLRVSECRSNGQEIEDYFRRKLPQEMMPDLMHIIAYHIANAKPKKIIKSKQEKYDIEINCNGKKYRTFKNIRFGNNPDLDIVMSLIYFLMTDGRAELDN